MLNVNKKKKHSFGNAYNINEANETFNKEYNNYIE